MPAVRANLVLLTPPAAWLFPAYAWDGIFQAQICLM